MVENMGGINLPHSQLKIKGKNGQKIDLTKLDGLQVTEKNKSLFAKYDKNNNGKIDKDEIAAMAKSLSDIAGNNKISKREIEKALGKGSYEELSKLAEQQNSVKSNKTYNEKGERTNVEIKPDGTRTETDNKTGHSTEISPNGKITVKDSTGKLLSTTELKNGKLETKEYTDLGHGKTYIETYNGEGDNKTLNHISVVDKKENKETKFKSIEDYNNNKPSEVITNANNPITQQTTTYTYNDDGTITTETIDSAGDIVENQITDTDNEASVEDSSDDDSSDDDDTTEDKEVEVEKKEPEYRIEETAEGHEKVERYEAEYTSKEKDDEN